MVFFMYNKHTRIKNYGTMEETRNLISNRPQSPVVYLEEKTALMRLFDGQKMIISLEDMAIMPHMVFDGVWEPYITIAWLEVAKRANTIIDVGSNIGYYSLISAKEKNNKDKHKIIGFEANPYLAAIASKNMAINWKSDVVKIENMAITDHDGPVNLTVLDDFIGCSSLATEEGLKNYLEGELTINVGEILEVTGISLDSYCEKKSINEVDLIKVDVEGLEYAVYQGSKNIIMSSPSMTMFIEFTNAAYENAPKFFETLQKDFNHMYLIEADGSLKEVTGLGYKEVIDTDITWQMLVVSKKTL